MKERLLSDFTTFPLLQHRIIMNTDAVRQILIVLHKSSKAPCGVPVCIQQPFVHIDPGILSLS